MTHLMTDMAHTSNIYWHFTGSPENVDWHSSSSPNKISKDPKLDSRAFDILKKIIETKKLIASATEQIFKGIETDKFCCVTDIPLKDLISHTKTYGKVAIGFSAKRIHTSLFNPVLYIPRKFLPIHQSDLSKKTYLIPAIPELEILCLNLGFEKASNDTWRIPALVKPVSRDKSLYPKHFINHLKITEFSDIIGESFYQEREWRKIGDFYFDYSDVESIIIPNEFLTELYDFFTERSLSIPIMTWNIIEKT